MSNVDVTEFGNTPTGDATGCIPRSRAGTTVR
jgi:hypothetical protein